MLKVFATNATVSKGYDGAPALKFSENDKGETVMVRFRIGERVYDSKCENNTRWVNRWCKAFGSLCDRIKKMQLKEGSFINFTGRLDDETWEKNGEKKTAEVITLDDIEYAGGNGGKKEDQGQESGKKEQAATPAKPAAAKPEASENFTGYETPFGVNGSFFDEN